jgi:precorrin-2 dehydrogenase/sirohydrochlorin ferrochelatase
MNNLFPIFLKLHEIDTLLVGGGNVGLEKLTAVLKNSPEARLTVVADSFLPEVRELIAQYPHVEVHERKFEMTDLAGKQLVILATDNPDLHKEIKETTKELGILTNVADTPHICDFYLGSVVRKGDLKIAISTNGKSPTFAKRFREYLEEALPDDIQSLLDNLQAYRNTLKGDFQSKIEALNKITAEMLKN